MGRLYHLKHAAKRRLATPFLRRLLRRPAYAELRAQVAASYLGGEGIEIGALNAPLTVPSGVSVRYVDYRPIEELKAEFANLAIRAPDFLTDFETFDGVADHSCDFIIANHVLEHVENPLRALVATARVLRTSGIAFIALPNKAKTFDVARSVTPLQHIVRDYADGPEWSRLDHYRDWSRNVQGFRGDDVEPHAEALEERRVNIHFHVWDPPAMAKMFSYAASLTGLRVAEVREIRA